MVRKRIVFIWAIIGALAVSLAQQEITVQPGDSLWAIAQRHNTTVEALKEANGLTDERLNPGHLLRLPDSANASPETYLVQPGDSLYSIALGFGLTVDDLIAINGLDGNVIRVGQVLKLAADAEATLPALLVVTVAQGDTLWAIAQRHDVSWQAIAEANGISGDISPGMQLTIPGRYGNSGDALGGPVPQSYQVVRGDTLNDIARRHSTSVAALMAANNMRTTALQAGQTLRIPSSDQLSAAVAAPRTAAPQTNSGLLWPANGTITSRFGYRNMRVAGSNFHTGLDIGANTGDPIRAAAGGTVVFSGWQGGYGNIVIIQNGNHEYRYAHASALLVSAGQTVNAGDVIARVGSTGYSTGPHLHFEVLINGQAVDPLPLLGSR